MLIVSDGNQGAVKPIVSCLFDDGHMLGYCLRLGLLICAGLEVSNKSETSTSTSSVEPDRFRKDYMRMAQAPEPSKGAKRRASAGKNTGS